MLKPVEFRAASATDYLRRKVNVKFDANAQCPTWNDFMQSITKGDDELCEYIRRVLGYTLFGRADLQVFFITIGSGGNGKGVLMRTVKKILGDYSLSVAPNLMTSAYGGNANNPSPALAALLGARMVICTELPSDKKLDEAFIKQYSGGDEIVSRHGYGRIFSFKPEGKLWLSTNDLPEISASDDAMWRRIKPIPFRAKFKGTKVDPKLEQKLEAEYSGILNWLLEGAKTFDKAGLNQCAAVERMEMKMREAADSVLAWVKKCCVTNVRGEMQGSLAYDSYRTFTRNEKRNPLSNAAFFANMKSKNFYSKRRRNGNYFQGLALRE